MSNKFNEIMYESIIEVSNNSIANLNPYPYNDKRRELILDQIAKAKIREHFKDKRDIPDDVTDLTDYKNIFDYDPALQNRLYDLQSERALSILSGRFGNAAKAIEKSNEIKQFEDLGRLIDSQNDGADVRKQIVNYYANGEDSYPQKQANLINNLAQYASPEKTPNTKYVLWMSDYNDVCSKCKKNNYKLFPVDEQIYRHPNCRCNQLYFNDVSSKAKRYLIVIFAGINTEENNPSMLALGEQLKQKLLERNNENTVDVEQIAPYADDVFDSLKVFQHAHFTTEEIERFTNQVIAKYSSGTYDFVLFIGYSGGGVMASRVAENINYRVPIDKIIRIGSPELFVNKNDYANITYDMSLANDPITTLHFTRENIENVRIHDDILTGYVINNRWNPISLHISYFTQDRDAFGVSNLDKTVNAILGQTG